MELDEHRIERILELSEENNKMLKKLVRSMRWARLLRVLYLAIIVASAIGVFYFLEPFIDELLGTYGVIKDSINSLGGAFK